MRPERSSSSEAEGRRIRLLRKGDVEPVPELLKSGPPRRILFGRHETWGPVIARGLSDAYFKPEFADLSAVDPAAYDAVIPLDLGHYDQLTRWWALRGIKFLAPDKQAADVCDDKQRLNASLRRAGFGDFLPEQYAAPPAYPYVLKPRQGGFGEDVHVVRSEADAALLHPLSPERCIEEYIPGRMEYAFHILMVGDRSWYNMRSSYQMRSEHRVRSEAEQPEHRAFHRLADCPALFLAMLTSLGYQGTACINYKMMAGRPKIMEINPRFGGSLTVDINAYVIAYLQALQSLG